MADFAWVGVGPLISKALADHGATVIHVESESRPDVLRFGPPFKDGEPGLNRSQFMANFNSSKHGLALNLATEEGRALARRLVEWADLVVESFTPGTMKKLGLDYPTIAKDRPELVMLSTCIRGQTGPDRTYAGFGLQGACLSGFHRITGWPDRQPAGTWGGLHGLHQSALRRGGTVGGALASEADGRRTAHRSRPERGRDSLRRAR